MSKGCVIYAYNNGRYDYVYMASVAARLVKKYLNIPVTLITDESHQIDIFDSVVVQPRAEKLQIKDGAPWHNQTRSTVYELSPYDQTLLIDADYFIFNSNLKKLFDTNLEFACYNNPIECSPCVTLERRISDNIPMQWATVIYFTRCELAKNVFEFMSYIRKHYDFYKVMYNLKQNYFRNDYALSIALQTLTGYSVNNYSSIPGGLHTLTPDTEIYDFSDLGSLTFLYNNGLKHAANVLRHLNIHVLNKDQLFKNNILSKIEKYAKS